MNIIFTMLALLSIFAEAFKLWKIDEILHYHSLTIEVSKVEPGDLKDILNKSLNDLLRSSHVLMLTIFLDTVYVIFTLMLLLTKQWYIGLFILLMTIIQQKFFKYEKKSVIIDSIMCIALLVAYIIITV